MPPLVSAGALAWLPSALEPAEPELAEPEPAEPELAELELAELELALPADDSSDDACETD